MKHLMKMVLGTVLSGAILVGCSPKVEPQKADTGVGEPAYTYVKDSYFLVKDGAILKQTGEEKREEILDWYFDPNCPSCTKLDEILAPRINDISSKMTIRYHAMGFLSPKSIDGYSDRASAFILAVAEKHPDLGLDFFHGVMNNNFKPKSGSGEKTPDSKFEDLFKEVGGKPEQWKDVVDMKDKMLVHVREETAKAFNDSNLLDKAKDRRLTVPFIVVGDNSEALNFLDTLDAETFVLDSIDTYLKAKEEEKVASQEEESKDEQAKEEEKKEENK